MESTPTANNPPGLPPVQPPSGRHIVQMFVVPGLIVAVVVVLFLGCSGFWGWLLGVSSTPEQDLARLESPNADVRWRAANNLAQILKRDDELARDPAFGLKLVQFLAQELDRLEEHEQRLIAKSRSLSDQELGKEMADFRTRRETIRYLSACLGNMAVPVGVPLLIRMARKDQGFDEKSTVLLRRHAVWMLANLGDNLKRLPVEKQGEVVQRFREATAGDSHAQQARDLVVAYYQSPEQAPELGVVAALAACAQNEDIFLREMVALALSFWQGSERENRLAEQTLTTLARDNGFGRRIEVGEND
jgi:hypothetical protein